MNDVMEQNGFSDECLKVLQVARQLYQERPDWVTFFRETLGVNGAARSVFSQGEYAQFEQSKEFSEIQKMVANLRQKKHSNNKNEATRVITVRLPESLHEALKAEASDHRTSMNKLCISKLLQVLSDNEEAMSAVISAARAGTMPINPAPAIPTPVAPPRAPAIQAVPSPQSPSFRSTYSPGVSNGAPSQNNQPRFGQ